MTKAELDSLTAYDGSSFALSEAPTSGTSLIGYFDTDEAARVVDRLLSARRVPFHLERAAGHWAGTRGRLVVTVPIGCEQEAQVLLGAAADAGFLERAAGADGLIHY